MHLRIRRRRFGQLAIASAASTAIANLAGKAVAQSPPTIYAVSVSNPNPQVSSFVTAAKSTPALTVKTADVTPSQNIISSVTVATTTVSNANTPPEVVPKASSLEPQERLTGLTTLSNGTVVNTSVLNSPNGDVTRLIFIDPKSSRVQNSLIVSGLPNNNSTVESLAAIKNDTLLSVISLNAGVPPFTLGTIDRTTGKVTSGSAAGLPSLNSSRRYSNLAQAPNGTIYATTLGREGATTLVTVDLANQSINTVVKLSYNNKPLSNDLLSITISPTGQIYALANPTYAATNSLFTVDQKTGVLTLMKPFDAEQITF